MAKFHDKAFDPATRLKLEIFRGYVREWLPVFLTRYKEGRRQHTQIGIYDFFAGPGHDIEGHQGSPLIIVEELRQFCQDRGTLKDEDIDIRVLFNDAEAEHIATLRDEVDKVACGRGCCTIEYSAQPFVDAFGKHLPRIRNTNSASLVIMDQCGVTDVTPEIVQQLAACKRTDILFFISSSFVRRFIDTPELNSKFTADAQGIRTVEYSATHRFICDYFRSKIGDMEYYLAPFSIKKGANIYGVIFGSSHLRGLEKFLEVCWAIDETTGEANYNIDGDFAWAGQMSFIPVHKVDLFGHDLSELIKAQSPTNHDVYKFCLAKGFCPSQAAERLRLMQKNGEVKVVDLASGGSARSGAFYLSYDNYKNDPRVRFMIRSPK